MTRTLMTPQTIDNRITLGRCAYAKRLQHIKPDEREKRAKAWARHAFNIPWQTRNRRFAYGSKLTFDPTTGEGRSYEWYEITRVFGDTLVLNTHGYSRTTGNHVSYLRGLLTRDLNLKYVELEAPQGLQDLRTAYEHLVDQLARTTAVAGRPDSREGHRRASRIADLNEQIALVRRLDRALPKPNITDRVTALRARHVESLRIARINRVVSRLGGETRTDYAKPDASDTPTELASSEPQSEATSLYDALAMAHQLPQAA